MSMYIYTKCAGFWPFLKADGHIQKKGPTFVNAVPYIVQYMCRPRSDLRGINYKSCQICVQISWLYNHQEDNSGLPTKSRTTFNFCKFEFAKEVRYKLRS